MTARWHLGPVTGCEFWRVLVFSPEILVFLFFMITDPKTIPAGRLGRRLYAVAIALLATLLIAPQTTEFGTKVAVLAALALVCAARPLAEAAALRTRLRWAPRGRARAAALVLAGAAGFAGLVVLAGMPGPHGHGGRERARGTRGRASAGHGRPGGGRRHADRSRDCAQDRR